MAGCKWAISLFAIALLQADPSRPTAPAQATAPPTEQPASAPSSPEETLWQQVVALRAEPAASQPFSAWFNLALRQRQILLLKLRLYLTLYPGGTHQAEAVRLELATLHEVGSLRGGDFGPLCARVQEYLRDGRPDDPRAWEAAYWDIFCRRVQRGSSTTQPDSAPVLAPDAELLAAYRQYVARYPRSPYVPRMASVLFEHAQQIGDPAQQRELVALLETNFPQHAVTLSLAAQWLRAQTVGHPFWLVFEQPDGTRVDTREFIGRPVLIVVWDSDAASRRCVSRVEEFRRAHPDVKVAGVNVDGDRDQMSATCGALGLEWPQFNDGLGRANRFAREWGVRQVPRVFVIDRRGRLVGSTEDDSWERMAGGALAGGR